MRKIGAAVFVAVCTVVLSASGTTADEARRAMLSNMVPKEYQSKRMPTGWWTDPTAIEEGKRIYEGRTDEPGHPGEACAVCHGLRGQPFTRGIRDLANASYSADMSESYWYWRVAEGVPRTSMMGWKEFLTEDQIWKVIAYEHTFSHGGRAKPHRH